MLNRIFFNISLLFLFTATSNSQVAHFDWEIGLCFYTGDYDSTKISKEQLTNTYLLCYDRSIIWFDTRATAWNPEQLDSLSLHDLQVEYKIKLEQLKNLKIIKSAFWEKQRQINISLLNRIYNLKQMTIKAYKKPIILKKYLIADSCFKYVDVLIIGGDSLLNSWKIFRKEQCQLFSDPIKCIDENYTQRYNSPQKLIWAQLDLMIFGWWNCANQFTNYNEGRIEADKEFRNLFQNIKYDCED